MPETTATLTSIAQLLQHRECKGSEISRKNTHSPAAMKKGTFEIADRAATNAAPSHQRHCPVLVIRSAKYKNQTIKLKQNPSVPARPAMTTIRGCARKKITVHHARRASR